MNNNNLYRSDYTYESVLKELMDETAVRLFLLKLPQYQRTAKRVTSCQFSKGPQGKAKKCK